MLVNGDVATDPGSGQCRDYSCQGCPFAAAAQNFRRLHCQISVIDLQSFEPCRQPREIVTVIGQIMFPEQYGTDCVLPPQCGNRRCPGADHFRLRRQLPEFRSIIT